MMEVVQDLTCPICLEFYTYPIILPCSHVLCRRPCAETIFEVDFIRCPVCRDNCYISGGINSLPRVIPLESIIEKMRAERKKRTGLRRISASSHNDLSISPAPSSSRTLKDASIDSAPSTSRTDKDVYVDSAPSTSRTIKDVSLESAPLSSRFFEDASFDTAVPLGISTSRQEVFLHDPAQSCNTRQQNSEHERESPVMSRVPNVVHIGSNGQESFGIFSCEELSTEYDRIMHCLSEFPRTSENRALDSDLTQPCSSTISPFTVEPRSSDSRMNTLSTTLSAFRASPSPDVTTETSIIDQEIQIILHPLSCLSQRFGIPTSSQTLNVHRESEMPNFRHEIVQTPSTETIDAIASRDRPSESDMRTSNNAQLAYVECRQGINQEGDITLLSSLQSGDCIGHAELLKNQIKTSLNRLQDVQCRLLLYLTSYRDIAQKAQSTLDAGRLNLTCELDSLVAQIEARRTNLGDGLDGAARKLEDELGDVTSATESLLESTQQLVNFAGEILCADPDVLSAAVPSLIDQLSLSVKTCEQCLETSEPSLRAILGHGRFTVDFRRERTSLEQLDYLSVPSPPIIDLQRCSRGHDHVILSISPFSSSEIVDSYRIMYCSEEQKLLRIEEEVCYTTHNMSLNAATQSFVLIEHLCSTTGYYFRACAVNKAGISTSSVQVQCHTLASTDCVVPVPSIVESHSGPDSSTSATITCHGPSTVSPHQTVNHFLLFRPMSGFFTWHWEEFRNGWEEHSVKELLEGIEYQFLVLAVNVRGESQVSEKLSFSMIN